MATSKRINVQRKHRTRRNRFKTILKELGVDTNGKPKRELRNRIAARAKVKSA